MLHDSNSTSKTSAEAMMQTHALVCLACMLNEWTKQVQLSECEFKHLQCRRVLGGFGPIFGGQDLVCFGTCFEMLPSASMPWPHSSPSNGRSELKSSLQCLGQTCHNLLQEALAYLFTAMKCASMLQQNATYVTSLIVVCESQLSRAIQNPAHCISPDILFKRL